MPYTLAVGSKRPFRRTITLAAVVGAITTVAVAWGIVDFRRLGTPEIIYEPPPHERMTWTVFRWQTWGSDVVGATLSSERSTDAMQVDSDRLPSWSRFHTLPAYVAGAKWLMLYDFAAGWPFYSMRCHVDIDRDPETGAPDQQSMRARGAFGKKCYPFIPLVPGFFADAAIYGAAWFFLLATPGFVRRRRRLRRGQCPACGYPRSPTSPVCTECGRSTPLQEKR